MHWAPRPRRLPGRVLAAVVGVGVLAGAGAARASSYTETHQTGDDVVLHVDGAGRAHVEHTLVVRVLAGQKRTWDLVGVEADALPEVQATVTDDGAADLHAGAVQDHDLTAQVAWKPGAEPPTLTVTVDDPKALRRGKYRIHLAYDVDLVATHELLRDGAMWRVSWKSPVATEGYDTARVLFDLPGAATAPRVVGPDADVPDESIVSGVESGPQRDEVTLTRPHVPRGEAAAWSLLVSPHAFPALHLEVARPPSAPPPARHAHWLGLGALLLGLGAAYGALVRRKENAFRAACRAAHVTPRALLPLPPWARAFVAGTALAAGVATQLAGALEAGSVLVALAMLCVALSVSPRKERARGPGRWLAVRPEEAFAARDPARVLDALDVGTLAGKACLALACGALAGVAFVAERLMLVSPCLVALDGLALLPLFATGRRVELPPGVGAVARRLRPLFRRLQKNRGLRVAPWARIPTGAHDPDELRLLVVPRQAVPGLIGIEVGIAVGPRAREYATQPEVLIRVHEASAASARMTTLVPRLMPVPGRRPEERVYRIAPRFPTHGWTRALVERLSRELYDRRAAIASWEGEERRIPRPPPAQVREKEAA